MEDFSGQSPNKEYTDSMKTQHDHDCSDCIFLGNFSVACGTETKKYDVYICPGLRGMTTTLIARFGSDGPDYYSRELETLNTVNNPSDIWVGVLNLMYRKTRP